MKYHPGARRAPKGGKEMDLVARDFLIDLIGYRRHGHNEGDEPVFTQSVMYKKIASHPTVREIWARTLVERGTIESVAVDQLARRHIEGMQQTMDSLRPEQDAIEPQPEAPPPGAADRASIRLTGEDVDRATFSHRHAVFHDANTGAVHLPPQKMPQARAAFEIHNSPLTENALIGFEFGYNIQEPSRLVIWRRSTAISSTGRRR